MIDMPVDVVRSQRRKKTAQAYVSNGRLRVLVPAGLSPEREAEIVEGIVGKAARRMDSAKVDLMTRAAELAERYRLPRPSTIEWSDRQMKRWGSCAPADGTIRISSRLADVPGWVLDWVIIHELAHLVEANHGKEFKALVNQYQLAERARGYLMCMEHQSRKATP